MNGRQILRHLQIGETPLVALPGLAQHSQIRLKAEYVNPFGSVKDRTAAYLLAWAQQAWGKADVRVVESTSGNLGFALASIGDYFGIRPTLVLDCSIPTERINVLRRTGADVVVVQEPRSGMTLRETRIAVASEISRRNGSVWLNQYANSVGVEAHRESTGPEIWNACNGSVDIIVASVGTGGTICGIGAALREMRNPPLIVGVEPLGSTISGGEEGEYLAAGSGMRGAPELVTRFGHLIDYFAQVPDAVAARWVIATRDRFNIQVGQTTGAAIAVAALLAERERCNVVAMAPDRGSGFSTLIRRLAASFTGDQNEELIKLRPFDSKRHVYSNARDQYDGAT